MKVELKEPDVSPLQIHGPDSKPVMEALFGGAIHGIKYYHCMETKLGDM